MELKTDINIRNFNGWTILSILFIIAGLAFYIWWGLNYGVWMDSGIYSITIVFVLGGFFGLLLSLSKEKKEEES